MKKTILFLLILVIAVLFGIIKLPNQKKTGEAIPKLNEIVNQQESEDIPRLITVAEGLDTPWAIAFLPDGGMLVTERPGRVRHIDKQGKLAAEPIASFTQVEEIGEGGLMGIVLHPNFSQNNYVYFYYTFRGIGNDTFNRVVRMKFEDNKFGKEKIIVDNIPGNFNHNGGRIKFGPDGNLYITTGDAQNPSQAQDKSSLAGKILRVTDEGKPEVYSYGHRNPQGIVWDKEGRFWSTEHGRSGIQSGFDELNLIEQGKNYGWPEIQGDEKQTGMETPILHSGASTTWAPAGAAFIGDSLFFGGLRGESLYEAVIQDKKAILKEHFQGEFGRIREAIRGPDNMLYITTSNRDGRGNPISNDDRIIRVNPKRL